MLRLLLLLVQRLCEVHDWECVRFCFLKCRTYWGMSHLSQALNWSVSIGKSNYTM